MKSTNVTKTTYSRSSLANTKNLSNAVTGSYYKDSRVNLLTKEIAGSFNTYRNWHEFDLVLPALQDYDDIKVQQQPTGLGIKSLFNNTAAVYSDTDIRKYLNIPLLDSPEKRQLIRDRTRCTVKELVTLSEAGLMGREVYNYSDFMYCKHLGKIPNNYMITLRKFPAPCSDHINRTVDGENYEHYPDMGRLITWIGTPGNEMEKTLSYNYSVETKTLTAPSAAEPYATAGHSGGEGIAGMLAVLDGTYGKEVAASGGMGYKGEENTFAQHLLGSNTQNGGAGKFGSGFERNVELRDQNRLIPSMANKIMQVKAIGASERDAKGLPFLPDIELQFDYELRSYDGINGRSAMLDLLGNILMVTYTQGEFFAGSYRTNCMATSNIYANLPVFKSSGTDVGETLSNMWDSFGFVLDKQFGFKSGASLKDNWNSFKNALSNIGNNLMALFANGLINKLGRPQKFAFTSMISPAPTGQWHLTVGNPRNPILSIGNLILTKATITHSGPLGLDDFPTNLTVKVTLEHAKPRDSVAIEAMYLHGDNRIYVPMGTDGIENMYDSAIAVQRSSKTKTENAEQNPNIEKKEPEIESSDNGKKMYKKYFGMDKLEKIKITAGEALTGAVKKESKKDK